MFVSFFPRPGLFGWSVILWTALSMALWYMGGRAFGAHLGLPPAAPGAPPIVGVQMFWSPPFLWFYIYFWGVRGPAGRVLAHRRPKSMVALVDPGIGPDRVFDLYPG